MEDIELSLCFYVTHFLFCLPVPVCRLHYATTKSPKLKWLNTTEAYISSLLYLSTVGWLGTWLAIVTWGFRLKDSTAASKVTEAGEKRKCCTNYTQALQWSRSSTETKPMECVCLCTERKKQRHREIYLKELAFIFVGAGKTNICRAD